MLNQKRRFKTLEISNIDLSLFLQKIETELSLTKIENQDNGLSNSLSWAMLEAGKEAIENGGTIETCLEIKNIDRAVGTILSHELTKKYKSEGMPEDSLKFHFKGTAGQSFGAFCNKGITLSIEGDANDYFGKGLSGAKLAIYPDEKSILKANENSIIGNVALYGATSGKAFINGMAGERFAVRNSGATAVVEGVGDHGCEYMTGGTVLILGSVGRNFGAGMSGGIAYIWDIHESLKTNFNADMADIEEIDKEDKKIIENLLLEHFKITKSTLADYLLSDLETNFKHIAKVFPRDYKNALQKQGIIV